MSCWLRAPRLALAKGWKRERAKLKGHAHLAPEGSSDPGTGHSEYLGGPCWWRRIRNERVWQVTSSQRVFFFAKNSLNCPWEWRDYRCCEKGTCCCFSCSFWENFTIMLCSPGKVIWDGCGSAEPSLGQEDPFPGPGLRCRRSLVWLCWCAGSSLRGQRGAVPGGLSLLEAMLMGRKAQLPRIRLFLPLWGASASQLPLCAYR